MCQWCCAGAVCWGFLWVWFGAGAPPVPAGFCGLFPGLDPRRSQLQFPSHVDWAGVPASLGWGVVPSRARVRATRGRGLSLAEVGPGPSPVLPGASGFALARACFSVRGVCVGVRVRGGCVCVCVSVCAVCWAVVFVAGVWCACGLVPRNANRGRGPSCVRVVVGSLPALAGVCRLLSRAWSPASCGWGP